MGLNDHWSGQAYITGDATSSIANMHEIEISSVGRGRYRANMQEIGVFEFAPDSEGAFADAPFAYTDASGEPGLAFVEGHLWLVPGERRSGFAGDFTMKRGAVVLMRGVFVADPLN